MCIFAWHELGFLLKTKHTLTHSISRSNPASFTPAVPPPTHNLQLPAPASTSSGSQKLGLCDQGVCKPGIAVEEVELLADVGPWLKENPFAMVSSSEQVSAASARAALCTDMHVHTLDPLNLPLPLHSCASLKHPSALRHIPDPPPSQRGQVSLSDNVTAVILPKHQLFATPPANFAEGSEWCVPPS